MKGAYARAIRSIEHRRRIRARPDVRAEEPQAPALTQAVLALQRGAGNHAVARLIGPPVYGPPAFVGEPVPGDGGEYAPPFHGIPLPGQDEEYGPGHGTEPGLTPAEEWEKLADVHRYFVVKTLKGYESLRGLFLKAFGVPRLSVRQALDAAKDYYAQLAPFTFMSREAIVHPNLGAALAAAEQKLGHEIPLISLSGVGIRLNANNDKALSNHSFGTAVDINADTSPNMGGMGRGGRRADIITETTGIDPRLTAEGKRISTDQQTFDEMLAEAERLKEASDLLVEVFDDEDRVVEIAWRVATERGDPAGGIEAFRPLMFEAGREEHREVLAEQARQKREQTRRDAAKKAGKKYERIEAPKDPWSYDPYPEFPDPDQSEIWPPESAPDFPDEHRDTLALFLFPTDDGGSTRVWDPAVVTTTVNMIAGMARMSEERLGDGGYPIPPQAGAPSEPQIAASGFMSVPPEVVAALSGSDAGDLRWLGMMSGAIKDYMHFELRENPPPLDNR